jgi:hypothetical protein
MKIKRILAFVLALAAAGTVFADFNDDVTSVLNDFLGRLTAKHEALESLAMPGVEVRDPSGAELTTQAVVILTFEKAGDQEAFTAALKAEEVPYGTFGEGEGNITLFCIDMMIFVMQDVIGL